MNSMRDRYDYISERERGRWEGVMGGLIAGVVLTLWIFKEYLL